MTRTRSAVALAAASTLTLTGCLTLAGCAGSDTGGSGTAPVTVVTSLYPLEFLVTQVGGDRVDVTTLTPPGADAHTLELSPSQVDQIGRADLVLYIRTLQAAVDEAVGANPPAAVVDASSVIELLPADEEHDHEHADDEGDHPDDGGHDRAGGYDPHLWLDPSRMPPIVEAVATELSRIDPDGATTYAANADDLTARFTDLDAAYRDGLASCEQSTFVVSHAAFGYLADRYGLEQVGISGIDEETEPSPARLAEISQIVEAQHVSTIFFGRASSPKVAEVFADALGLDVGVLSTILSVEDGEDFFTVSEANLEALRDALGCA